MAIFKKLKKLKRWTLDVDLQVWAFAQLNPD